MKNYFLMSAVITGLILVSTKLAIADTQVLTSVEEEPKNTAVAAPSKEDGSEITIVPVVVEEEAVAKAPPPVQTPPKEEKVDPDTLVHDAITGKKIERVSPFDEANKKEKESLRDSVRSKLKD